jgi:hypothetical protein
MSDGTGNTLNGADGESAAMTTGEMLELAAIDALGLLDDAERAAFDRAFARAPSAVRELIHAEQARVAEAGLALPDVDAPDALREKVLARIRAEIERAGTPAPSARTAAHAGGHRAEPRSLGLRRARRVSPSWRIATIGASVAAVVLAVVQVQLRQEIDYLSSKSETAAMLEAIGLEFIDDVLFADAVVQEIQLVAVGDVGRAEATLVRNPDHDRARLYVKNLASRTDYTVVTLDEAGGVDEQIAAFESDDLLTAVDLRVPGQAGETVRVAIMSTGIDPEILFVAEVRLA